jgi:hypothetical protein
VSALHAEVSSQAAATGNLHLSRAGLLQPSLVSVPADDGVLVAVWLRDDLDT